MDLLAHPQGTFPVIHVTDTNGKTSTARIVEAVLREHGLTTGLFDLAAPARRARAHPDRRRADDPQAFVAAYDEAIPLVELVEAATGCGSTSSRPSS